MKIDLDELERKIKSDHNARLTRGQTIALIARIRELEEDIREWIDVFEECPDDFKETKALLEKGAVIRDL